MNDASEVNFETLGQIGPCQITLVGFPFVHPQGREELINYTISIDDGDYQAVLDAIIRRGGAYLPSQDDAKIYWFLPWPCAAVQIRPIPK